jgi:hypothetical protein
MMGAMLALVCCAALVQAPAPEPWPSVRVASPSGAHEAVIEKAPGQERVRDAFARWRVAVRRVEGDARIEVWSAPFPYLGRGRFALADGGLVFASAFEPFQPGAPVLRVHREGAETLSARGSELGLPRGALVPENGAFAWVDPEPDALRFAWRETSGGPTLALLVRTRGGSERRDLGFDALGGALLALDELPLEPDVEPAPLVDEGVLLAAPFVTSFRVPAVIRAGEPLALEVEGSFPTPNWYIAGYALEVFGDDARALVVRPLAAPPKATIQAAVLQGFRGAPRIGGLTRGRWTIALQGREPTPLAAQAVEVLPSRLVARSIERSSDGETVCEWYANGALGEPAESSWRLLSRAEHAQLARLADELPARVAVAQAAVAPFALGWWNGEQWNEWRGELERAPAAVRDLAQALARE